MFVVSWEIDGETYTQREDFFFPYLLLGARGCQRLHPLASSSETHLIGCVTHARLRFSALCPNLTAWFSSHGLLPVTHLLYPSALTWCHILVYSWQLVKANRVSRNEPKIHVICYITYRNAIYCGKGLLNCKHWILILFLHKLLKSETVWIKIGPDVRLRNDIDFSKIFFIIIQIKYFTWKPINHVFNVMIRVLGNGQSFKWDRDKRVIIKMLSVVLAKVFSCGLEVIRFEL